MNQSSCVFGLILACVGWTTSVYAQEPSETTAPESGQLLEEIIITAQKREENLQDTPIAVSALTSEVIEAVYATDLRGIGRIVPSLVVTNVVNVQASASFSIRGIGIQEANGFVDPSVGVVVDGVYLGNNTTALLDLFDIERIEVLRGPQGTLFGANTIGGVINVITRQPSGEFGGSARLVIGDRGRFDLAATVDIPLIQGVLAGKATVMTKKFDGFYYDLRDGRDLAGESVTSARGYLQYTPTDEIKATLQLEYGRGRNDSPPVINYSDPDFATYVPGVSRSLDDPIDFGTASQDFNYSDYDIDGATLTIGWSWGGAELVSISNYRELTLDEWTDQDGTPEFLLHTLRITDNRQYSQELRATFTPSDTTEVISGIYYFNQNWKLDQVVLPEFAAPGADLRNPILNDQDDEAISGFAQGYWNTRDNIRLQAGLRYTWQEKELRVNNTTLLGDTVLAQVLAQGKESWTNWGWRIGADWHIADKTMLYVSYSRGFKSGGFNGFIAQPADIGPYDPVEVDTYEVGVKADWLGGRLRTNAALFYNDYSGLQIDRTRFDENSNPITRIENAAEVTTKGAELELVALLVKGWTVSGSVSYLDAQYDEFFFSLDGTPEGFQDASFLALRNAPEWQTSLGTTYEFAAGPGRATLNALWTYSSRRETDVRNAAIGSIDPLNLVDVSVLWTPTDEAWTVGLRVKNLFDEKYRTQGFSVVPNILNLVSMGNRREVQAELTYKF
jgi:iron complex outermembrane receptor protein